MRATPRQRQQISQGEPIVEPHISPAGDQHPHPSAALALQNLLQKAFYEPKIEQRLPVGQRALVIILLAAASWGLIGGVVFAVVH